MIVLSVDVAAFIPGFLVGSCSAVSVLISVHTFRVSKLTKLVVPLRLCRWKEWRTFGMQLESRQAPSLVFYSTLPIVSPQTHIYSLFLKKYVIKSYSNS